MRLVFRRDTPPLAWGKPDSPARMLCAICHGSLPDVPLMMWDDKGAGVRLCDDCVDRWIEVVE